MEQKMNWVAPNMGGGCVPPQPYEQVAEKWAACRKRLLAARNAMAEAQKELEEATQVERSVWEALEGEAERSTPKAPMATGSFR